jgi:hypothetical protein
MRALLLALPLVAACSSGLPAVTLIEKLRVLAVRAEPAEPAPGEETRLDALVAQPPVVQLPGLTVVAPSYLWLSCSIPPGAAQTVPCGVAGPNVLPGTAEGAPRLPPRCADAPNADLCLIGRDAEVRYPAPGAGQRLLTLVVADTPEGAEACLLAAAANQGVPTVPDQCVLAQKRLSITTAAVDARNHNPSFRLLDGNDGLEAWSLESGGRYRPGGEPDSRDLTFVALRSDDAAELRPDPEGGPPVYETLTASWFVTAGRLGAGRSALPPPGCAVQVDCPDKPARPDADTRWTPPDAEGLARHTTGAAGEVFVYAVIRDDRGGVGWRSGVVRRR